MEVIDVLFLAWGCVVCHGMERVEVEVLVLGFEPSVVSFRQMILFDVFHLEFGCVVH
jgi:hypothetical protein